jgi:hypothetical protein
VEGKRKKEEEEEDDSITQDVTHDISIQQYNRNWLIV